MDSRPDVASLPLLGRARPALAWPHRVRGPAEARTAFAFGLQSPEIARVYGDVNRSPRYFPSANAGEQERTETNAPDNSGAGGQGRLSPAGVQRGLLSGVAVAASPLDRLQNGCTRLPL
jgi:hypothetical protein